MLRRRGEDGFTLVELLVAVVILGIIMVPLATVMIGFLRNTDAVTARLGESHDQQTAAAYWQQDVSSIGLRSSTYDIANHTFPLLQSVNTSFGCAVPAGTTPVVVLAWNSYDSAGSATSISFAYLRDATRTQLLRLHCTGSTVDSSATLAHELDAAVAPTVACTGTGGTACTGSGSNVPATVSLSFSVRDTSGKGQPYSVTLNGQRRQT
jgi:prepilin-type N-terminal cleavage/methylation domain-containing protein